MTAQKPHIDLIYSTPDDGYYAEIWEPGTGRKLYSSPVMPTPEEARTLARDWVAEFYTDHEE